MDTKGEVGNKLGWEKHIHTAIYKTDKQGRTFQCIYIPCHIRDILVLKSYLLFKPNKFNGASCYFICYIQQPYPAAFRAEPGGAMAHSVPGAPGFPGQLSQTGTIWLQTTNIIHTLRSLMSLL